MLDETFGRSVSVRTHGLTERHCPHEAVIEVRLLVCPSPVERQAASVGDGSGNEPSIRYGIETVHDQGRYVTDTHTPVRVFTVVLVVMNRRRRGSEILRIQNWTRSPSLPVFRCLSDHRRSSVAVETERYFTWNRRVQILHPLRRLSGHLLLMATVKSGRYFIRQVRVRIPVVGKRARRIVRYMGSPDTGRRSDGFPVVFPHRRSGRRAGTLLHSGAGSPGSSPGGGTSAVV